MTYDDHGKTVGYPESRMFGNDGWTPGAAMKRGVLIGSMITVIMFFIWVVISSVMGGWDESTAVCLSYIIAGIAGGILQQTWFNPRISLSMRYPARIAGFGITYFVVLAGCAWLGGWLPVGVPAAWISFAVTYLVLLTVITLILTRRYHRDDSTYDELLAAYRAKQDDDKHES